MVSAWDQKEEEDLCNFMLTVDFADVLDVFDVEYIDVNYGQCRYKVICPIHKDGNELRPSLHVFDNGEYHCFSCGAHGDVLTFASIQVGSPRVQAAKILSQQLGMTDCDEDAIEVIKNKATRRKRISETEEIIYNIGADLRDWLEGHRGSNDYRNMSIWLEKLFIKLDNKIAILDEDDTESFNKMRGNVQNMLRNKP